jgi:hypothetical protein
MARRDLLTRLADAGEEAIARLGDTPGADRLLGVANSMRDRMDELQRRVRGLEAFGRRSDDLNRRVDLAGLPVASLESPAAGSEDAAEDSPSAKATTPAGTAHEPGDVSAPASETTQAGSEAEPVGPATGGASQVGNPQDEDV